MWCGHQKCGVSRNRPENLQPTIAYCSPLESLARQMFFLLPCAILHSSIFAPHSINIMHKALNDDLISGDFHNLLTLPTVRKLLGHDDDILAASLETLPDDWVLFILSRANILIKNAESAQIRNGLFFAGCAALQAFLQSNITGPPLSWLPSTTLFPQKLHEKLDSYSDLSIQLVSSLTVDGETAYALTPNVELFCLAKCLLNHPAVIDEGDQVNIRFRLRVNSWHQRMLSEIAPSLQKDIYRDLDILERTIPLDDHKKRAEFLVERAEIHIRHGFDARAKADLTDAAKEQKFAFALTGRLGKRTKFQQSDLSQLVVLAKSNAWDDDSADNDTTLLRSHLTSSHGSNRTNGKNPLDLKLNDDTLLEYVSFSKEESAQTPKVDQDYLPESLQNLDPAGQPALHPLDSIILLATASSITNTSPQDGLTREETLPYAIRVLTGSGTNWQIYTQALLVRSRIEGYKSRTAERGLLQLQAIVDQVIAETITDGNGIEQISADQQLVSTSTFLPQAKSSESAPAGERLRYIHLLASPTRWRLESELADRWVTLGGLRSALEIYERLRMWAEVALCWAATDREDEARRIIRSQLYLPIKASATSSIVAKRSEDQISYDQLSENERDPLPNDAPRLFCILGDLERSVTAYERAWEVSNHRYARAQRSLGKHYSQSGELKKADEAYAKSLQISPQNHGVWFALGCVRLRVEDWTGAVDAFARAVQIEDQDAESWSNLAAALLQLPTDDVPSISSEDSIDGSDTKTSERNVDHQQIDLQKHTREAFVALKRAANLKRDSYRIWQNLLQVAIQLLPPPYIDIIVAQTRLIDLLGSTRGENCVDVLVVEGLVNHLIESSTLDSKADSSVRNDESDKPHPRRSSYEKMVIELVQKKITPLITSSRRLWLVTAKLSLYLQRPQAALSAYEKAWRVTTNQPGWESGTAEAKDLWKHVTDATIDLVDAYESLGERTRESGLGEGELVAKDWRFKSRSAIRGIVGRAKDGWEGSLELDMLRRKLDDLKAT